MINRMEVNNQSQNSQNQNPLHIQLRNSENGEQMRQILFNCNNQDYPDRKNRVKSVNMSPTISPKSNTTISSNKLKKVLIFAGESSQQDSKQNQASYLNQNDKSPNKDYQSSPNMQGRSYMAKSILKNMDSIIETKTQDKNSNLSFTTAHEEQRRQISIHPKADTNNNLHIKGNDLINLLPNNQRKQGINSKQQNQNNVQTQLNQNNGQLNVLSLKQTQSISLSDGTQSEQIQNKSLPNQNKIHNLEINKNNIQNLENPQCKENKRYKLNSSVDFSTISNIMSDGDTQTTQPRINFFSPEQRHSPILDKIMKSNSNSNSKDISSNNYTESIPYLASNQKFRLTNNSYLQDYQISTINNAKFDNIQDNEKFIGQKENKPIKFQHSQSYLRKRIYSIENQMPHGSLPNINEDVYEENIHFTQNELNLSTEEVNRKKIRLLERLRKGSTPNKFHYDEHYYNKKLEDKLYDSSSISIHHPSRNIYDDKNPLRAYQVRSNIPLANTRIVTDPSTYTHQLYYKANKQRQKDQERVIQLLEEQDKIMNRIITKYQKRSEQEENSLKMKLKELEKDRDSLLKLKEQEQMLGLMQVSLSQKVDHFKKNMDFHNNSMKLNMPNLRPNMENAFSDIQDLAFLDSILKQGQYSEYKKRNQKRNQSKQRNKSLITSNYNNKIN